MADLRTQVSEVVEDLAQRRGTESTDDVADAPQDAGAGHAKGKNEEGGVGDIAAALEPRLRALCDLVAGVTDLLESQTQRLEAIEDHLAELSGEPPARDGVASATNHERIADLERYVARLTARLEEQEGEDSIER